MTVLELIENLNKIEDKNMRVVTYINSTGKHENINRVLKSELDFDIYIEKIALLAGELV